MSNTNSVGNSGENASQQNEMLTQHINQFLQQIQPLITQQPPAPAAQQPSVQQPPAQQPSGGPHRRQIFRPSRLRLPTGFEGGSNQSTAENAPRQGTDSRPVASASTAGYNSGDEFQDNSFPTIEPVLRHRKRTRLAVSRSEERVTKRHGRVVTKDVVVLPQKTDQTSGMYQVPNAATMANLVSCQLVGKIRFGSTDSAETIRSEIHSLFGVFPFSYLQILPGNRKLVQPFVSRSVQFDGATLLSLSPQGQLYLIAEGAVPSSIQQGIGGNDDGETAEPSTPQTFPDLPACQSTVNLTAPETCSKGHTVRSSETCLICDQDQEYEESLAADRARQPQLPPHEDEDDMNRIPSERALRLPDEPRDGFFIRVRAAGHTFMRRFCADQDIQVLMDFIGSQPRATQLFAVRESSSDTIALESSLEGSPLSHYGLTSSVVLHVDWSSDSEVRQMPQEEEPSDTDLPDLGVSEHLPCRVITHSAGTGAETEASAGGESEQGTNIGGADSRRVADNAGAEECDDDVLIVADIDVQPPTTPLARLIRECQSHLSGTSPLLVLRDDPLETALEEISHMQPSTGITVLFEGEEGQDGGGLLRELNSLILLKWPSSVLSNDSGRGFSLDATALDDGLFRNLGRYVAKTTAQGTTGLPVFPDVLAHFILNQRLIEVKPSDFETEEQCEIARKLMTCTLEEVDDVIDRVSIGCSKTISSLTEAERQRWLRGLYRKEVLATQCSAIAQFRDGLQLMLDVWTSSQENVEIAVQFLSRERIPTPSLDVFLGLFQLKAYGTERSQLATRETRAYFWFQSFLKDVFADRAECKSEAERQHGEPSPEPIKISPADIIAFFTGALWIPPGGFESTISIHFEDECSLPHISTCALNATLPLQDAGVRSVKKKYCFWFLPGNGFGIQ